MAKVLAFTGSNSRDSINHQFLSLVSDLITHEVEILDLSGINVPIYSKHVEADTGLPTDIASLKAKINQADYLLIASPEHNSSIPAFFKNIVDWLSRMEGKTFSEKPAIILSTSPGGRGGMSNLEALKNIYPWWGGGAVLGTYSLPSFSKNVEGGRLLPAIEAELKSLVQAFK